MRGSTDDVVCIEDVACIESVMSGSACTQKVERSIDFVVYVDCSNMGCTEDVGCIEEDER